MKGKGKTVPKFRNEDEERAFWDKESPLDYFDPKSARKAAFPNLKPSTETISLRLPASLLFDIKMLANKNDVPYQSFMKIMLADRVREKMAEYRPEGSSER
jgi:predicted DNA binding CopG/RHH family protein